jgi:hypothetical protein
MMVAAGISRDGILRITNLILAASDDGYMSRFDALDVINSVEATVPSPDKQMYDGWV